MDSLLREMISQWRRDYENDARSLNRVLPPIPFNEAMPATFALTHLQRKIVIEWKQYHFDAHDARDLCHAVVATAYSSICTLDKAWKRRIEGLPQPHRLARVFYSREIDSLIDVLESSVPAK